MQHKPQLSIGAVQGPDQSSPTQSRTKVLLPRKFGSPPRNYPRITLCRIALLPVGAKAGSPLQFDP